MRIFFIWSLALFFIQCHNSHSDPSLVDKKEEVVIDSAFVKAKPSIEQENEPVDSVFFEHLDAKEGDYEAISQMCLKNDDRTFVISPQLALPSSHKDTAQKVIHLFVALCDVRFQGIAPTPLRMANGQKPNTNLYWGAGYGIKNYFDRHSKDWKLLQTWSIPTPTVLTPNSSIILERCLFQYKNEKIFLVADAYDGRCIRETTSDFIRAAAGQQPNYLVYEQILIPAGGAADFVGYIGHNGLMDFMIESFDEKGDLACPASKNEKPKPAIALACSSKLYFSEIFHCAKADPIIWTKSLMGPEAYTVHDALNAWLEGEAREEVLDAGLRALARYQNISLKAANTILTQGF